MSEMEQMDEEASSSQHWSPSVTLYDFEAIIQSMQREIIGMESQIARLQE